MTFERWNTLARTGFLGLLTCVLIVLAFQVSGMLEDSRQDENSLALQASELLSTAKDFVPKTPLDMSKVNGVVSSVQAQVNATGPAISAAGLFMQQLNVSATRLNVPCPENDNDKLHPCGTLADVAKTLNTGRHTLAEIEIGVNNFDRHEDALFDQEQQTWAKANQAIDSANTLFDDPDIKTILAHVATGSGTFDHMLDTGDRVETRVTKCTLHPTFMCKFTGWILPAAQITGALLH